MSKLRRDPLTGRWVVVPERNNWPGASASGLVKPLANTENRQIDGFCLFCPGNEDKTLPEIFALRSFGPINGSGWKVRVIPGDPPTFRIEGDMDREGEGPYDKMQGIGAHEVIIGPDHWDPFHRASFEQARVILSVAKDRMIDLERDPRFRYLLLVEDCGFDAGALLKHPHLELIAFPITPLEAVLELQATKAHYEKKARCLLCDIANFESLESKDSSRVVVESPRLIAFAPFASRFPYEIMIMPKSVTHAAYFTEIDVFQLNDLVQILQIVLKKLESVLGYLSYNLVLHMAPFFRHPERLNNGETIRKDYHWHIHIFPRNFIRIDGFELGTQFFINPIPPEIAAEKLRETTV